ARRAYVAVEAAGRAHAATVRGLRLPRDRVVPRRQRGRGARQRLPGAQEAPGRAGGPSMTTYDDALIALLIDGVAPAPEVARWLRTAAGRRRLASYRRTVVGLRRLYGDLRPRPVVYWCSLPSPVGRVLVAASDTGLVRVGFRRNEASFVADLQRSLDAE